MTASPLSITNVSIEASNILRLEEDASKGDYIDLTDINKVDNKYINDLIEKEYKKRYLEDLDKEIKNIEERNKARIIELNSQNENKLNEQKFAYESQIKDLKRELETKEDEFRARNKEEILKLKEFQNIRSKAKNLYETILFLSPELFKFLNINEKDNINNYSFPQISGICEKQKQYSFNDINVSIVKYENSREVFLRKNGFDYFCLQFEYFFQLANYYTLFMNQQQEKLNRELEKEKSNIESKNIEKNEIIDKKAKEENYEKKEETEINTISEFYQENIELIIDLIKNSINNTLLLLTQNIADLYIMNFSVNLKKMFSSLLSAMKSLNNIRNIISSSFHPLNSIIILICEQIQERYYRIKNKTSSDYAIKFLTSFRDGLIVDILLFNEFLNSFSDL